MGKDNFHMGLRKHRIRYQQAFAICDTRAISYEFKEDLSRKSNGENPEKYYFIVKIFYAH